MIRRGYVMVIRGGDAEISGAIAEGIMSGRRIADPAEESAKLTAEQIEVVQAEIDRQHIQRALLRVAVGNTNTAEDYRNMMTKARGDYGIDTRPPGPLRRVGDRLLQLYALAVLAISAAYHSQDAVLGRR